MKLDEIIENYSYDNDEDEDAAMEEYFDRFTRMTEPEMIAAVKEDPDNIMHMSHATEKVQLTAVKEYGGALRNFWADRPSKAVVNAALTEPTFVHDKRSYDALVKDMFADNSILMNKWLRYGDNMRNM